jgi:signal transduction histidine kinase
MGDDLAHQLLTHREGLPARVRMAIAFFPSRLRDRRRGAPLEAFSHNEKVIAFCRLSLAVTTLVLELVAPKQPPWAHLAYGVLGAYVGYSALLFFLVRGEWVRQERAARWSVACDIVWAAAITIFTEGGATPFFLLNVFVISSVSVRWGFAATAAATMLLASSYPVLMFVVSNWIDPDTFTFHWGHLLRPAYLMAVGYLIGYLGEHERRSKRKLGFMLDLTTALRRDRASTLSLTRVMRRVLGYFDAPRGLLVLRDPESSRYFAWDFSRRGGRLRLAQRIAERDPLPVPFASSTEAFLANAIQPGSGTALCYDVVSGALQRKAIQPDLRLPADGGAQAVLVVPVLVQRELRGRVLIAREARPNFTRDDLEFLLVIVGQAAAGFEAARLQEKAEEVAVLEERARIARDLHDGFIQSLAGIDLRVEALRLMHERDPARVPGELAELQQTVDRGYREVRHYLSVLRSSSRQARDLTAALDRVVAEFSIRDRLRVQLTLPPGEPGLSPGVAYELTQIVREALRNAVRHGHASEAEVRLATYDSHCSLTVRDNGRGFRPGLRAVAADGAIAPANVPWSIRERAAALGATLRVRSRPGEGAELVLQIPSGPRDEGRVDRPRRRA